MVADKDCIPPPPRPWMVRPAMSIDMLLAPPQMPLPVAKRAETAARVKMRMKDCIVCVSCRGSVEGEEIEAGEVKTVGVKRVSG